MAAEGVELLAGLDDLAVMGFVEVLGRLRFFHGLEKRIRSLLDAQTVDLVLPIDYPGLNLRIARYARERNVPVLYYIAPQVWAWRAGRINRLVRDADHVAVILPFEVDLFQAAGGRVTFVGHPLLDEPVPTPGRAEFAAEHDLDPDRPLLALFPGSRSQEIERHLAVMLETSALLRSTRPELQVAVAQAASVPDLSLPDHVTRVRGSRALLSHADAALVKSGTSTLEAALAGVPFVCVYRAHPLTYAIARRLVRTDYIALANLVAGARVVPEMLQGDATTDRLAAELAPLLDPSNPRRQAMVASLKGIRKRLGQPGAAKRVAELAAGLLSVREPLEAVSDANR